MEFKKWKKGFTHGGKFHSDDVFATALLRILNPEISIERGFEVPDNFDGIVYDIGRGKYDHHQTEKEIRDNGVAYAAFGLIWREVGPLLVGEEETLIFDEKFVQPLDESDNTGSSNALAKVIAEFNPGWDSDEDADDAFWRAEAMAETILQNHLNYVAGIQRGREFVKKEIQKNDGQILILSQFVPWKEEVVGTGYQFVIYPSKRGGYNVQGVPQNLDTTELVCEMPKEWHGKEESELVELTGIESMTFCHASGFLASAGTLEDAISIAQLAMK